MTSRLTPLFLSGLQLSELQLLRTLLYPPSSHRAFIPAFFDVRGRGLVSLAHMHMHVPCATLRDYQPVVERALEQAAGRSPEQVRCKRFCWY